MPVTRLQGAVGGRPRASYSEDPDPTGQAVDVALGSRSYMEATARSHGCGAESRKFWTGGGEGVPERSVTWGFGGNRCPGQAYPRSSNDSKMSVSMRSHSMLLWYSNFRVAGSPSPATRTFEHVRASEPPSQQLAPQPLHCACLERAQETWFRLSPSPGG